jgi:hypothetical protein
MGELMEVTNNTNNILQYCLYKESKSKQFKLAKVLYYYIVPIIMFLFGFFGLYDLNSKILLIIFSSIGILAIILFRTCIRNYYVKHHKNFINNNFDELIVGKQIIEIIDEKITLKNNISESSTDISVIKYLIELKNCYIMGISDAVSFVLPKNNEGKEIFETIKNKNNLNILDETKWKW